MENNKLFYRNFYYLTPPANKHNLCYVVSLAYLHTCYLSNPTKVNAAITARYLLGYNLKYALNFFLKNHSSRRSFIKLLFLASRKLSQRLEDFIKKTNLEDLIAKNQSSINFSSKDTLLYFALSHMLNCNINVYDAYTNHSMLYEPLFSINKFDALSSFKGYVKIMPTLFLVIHKKKYSIIIQKNCSFSEKIRLVNKCLYIYVPEKNFTESVYLTFTSKLLKAFTLLFQLAYKRIIFSFLFFFGMLIFITEQITQSIQLELLLKKYFLFFQLLLQIATFLTNKISENGNLIILRSALISKNLFNFLNMHIIFPNFSHRLVNCFKFSSQYLGLFQVYKANLCMWTQSRLLPLQKIFLSGLNVFFGLDFLMDKMIANVFPYVWSAIVGAGLEMCFWALPIELNCCDKDSKLDLSHVGLLDNFMLYFLNKNFPMSTGAILGLMTTAFKKLTDSLLGSMHCGQHYFPFFNKSSADNIKQTELDAKFSLKT